MRKHFAGLLVLFSLFVVAAPAAASVTIGPNPPNAQLHSWTPEYFAGQMTSYGGIDLNEYHLKTHSTVCIQVREQNGSWVDKSGTCSDLGWHENPGGEFGYSNQVAYTSGHVYRGETNGTVQCEVSCTPLGGRWNRVYYSSGSQAP